MFAPTYFPPTLFAPTYFPEVGLVLDFRQGLVATLAARAAISSVVGNRIYPLKVPESTTPLTPALTYQIIANPRDHHLDGANGITRARVQISAVTRTFAETAALTLAVRNCFDGWYGTLAGGVKVIETLLLNESELYEEPVDASDLGTYRTVLDIVFRYRESLPTY
ncbi:MAG: hypothetical protein NVSMB9_28540 [Isosphaeraceae bacterium]